MKLLAAAMVALVSLVTLPACASAASGTPRVLIVGDSVTQGGRGDFTWRYFLWESLGPGAADFVGPRRGTFAVRPSGQMDWDYREGDAYADPDFDQDHGAFAGGRLARPVGPDDPGRYFHEPIEQLSADYQPDVIMALWGINDLGYPGQTPTTVIDSYRSWLAAARSVNPDVDFVIGTLPYTWLSGVPAFNAALTELGAAESTPRSAVVIAEMSDSYTLADSVDQVHPNVSGQQKIARMMGQALATYDLAPVIDPGDVPVPPAAPPAAWPAVLGPSTGAVVSKLAPRPPRRVRAAREGRLVVVRWKASRRAQRYVVKCGPATRQVRTHKAALRSQSTRCKVRSINAAGASPWASVRVRVRG